ncbi:MAG: GNAT family N-acetyltransferase [Gammaproteobacteria bacterium]
MSRSRFTHENVLTDLRLSLRPGRRQDGETLHALIGDILESYGLSAECIANDGDLNDVASWYGSRNGVFKVLEDSRGVLMGCYGVFARSVTICELRRLYLVSTMRHRGLGHVFMEHVLQWARDRGFDSMELFTAPALKQAVALYSRYGFVRVVEMSGENTSTCDLHFRLHLHHGRISS